MSLVFHYVVAKSVNILHETNDLMESGCFCVVSGWTSATILSTVFEVLISLYVSQKKIYNM